MSITLVVSLVVVTAGCAAAPASPGENTQTTVDRPASPTAQTPTPAPTATPTPTATHTVPEWVGDPPTGTETPPVGVSTARDRAIDHETERIRSAGDSLPRVTGLGVGILRPPSAEPIAVDETGVTLRVEVGYSLELDCDASADSTPSPEEAIDGASTITRYFVGETTVRLLSVERGVLDPDRYCDSPDGESTTETEQ